MGRGTIRRMVEGKCAAREYHGDGSFDLVQHIPRGNTEDRNALIHDPGVPRDISIRIAAHLVRDAINLDRKPGLRAVEIEHVSPKRMLAPELDSVWPCPEDRPKLDLR
jgi:hypothetical protein